MDEALEGDEVEEEDSFELVELDSFVDVELELSDGLFELLELPFVEADEAERESVMYHPLPLNTMPTGWITLRSAPPHCSHVVSGGSEKLWRFSITSLQAVHV